MSVGSTRTGRSGDEGGAQSRVKKGAHLGSSTQIERAHGAQVVKWPGLGEGESELGARF